MVEELLVVAGMGLKSCALLGLANGLDFGVGPEGWPNAVGAGLLWLVEVEVKKGFGGLGFARKGFTAGVVTPLGCFGWNGLLGAFANGFTG